ncbi:MAG: T9SS type A sorting domain-containing protein [Chitinophagales bacterium]|nr:T9SS type A sorting domain-containing protein [Chitinophagaceae bacterium]MCB9065368.1 T9SS type A sorting domain-containing protein [Chitinophagales bacterium]
MKYLKSNPFFKLCLLVVSLLMLQPEEAQASHFRYGNITWERVAGQPLQIRFRVTQAWRRSAFSNPNVGQTINGGALNTGSGSVSISLLVTSVNAAEDWFYGEFTYIKTYPSTGTYTAQFGSCCRIGSPLVNNSGGNFIVSSIVTVGNGNDAPVSTVPPFVSLPVNTAAATYQLPATDPNNDAMTFALAPNGSFGSGTSQPPGISVSSSGLLTFNTVGKGVGQFYNTAIYVTDAKGARIQLDLMLRIAAPSTPPAFDYSVTPTNGANYVLQPGQALSFNVKASDVDAGDNVSLNAVGVPSGATFTPTSGNPVTQSFSWTPTVANVGTYQVNFVAQDNASIQTSTIVNIAVSLKPNFVSPSPADGSIFCYVPGSTINHTFKAEDADTADRVILSLASASQSGMSFSPTLPTAQANPVSTNFTWNTTSANWGVNPVVIRATDTYTETKDDTVFYIINTPPVFTTSQSDVTITAGQTFTYVVGTNDADIPQGDEVDVESATLPSWLSIVDNNNGTWTISGTPVIADSGEHFVNIEIEDEANHFRGTHCGNATQSFKITVLPCAITSSASVTDVACNGDATGAVDLTVNNATPPVSYAWSNSATSEDLSGVAAGTYSVYITDNNGCMDSATATVGEPSALATSVSGTNNVCNGGTSGAVDLTVSGGTPGYSYSWSNSATTEDISGLAAGSYSVTVTDANGCTATDGYTVTEPTAITASISVSPSPTIAGHSANTIYLGYGAQSVTLTASAGGGTPGYSYSWSNSATTAATTVSPTTTTTYTCTITDANGCTHTVSQQINVVDARCGNNNNKVLVCHISPGNGKQNNICISSNAVATHLAHGCYVGPCGANKAGRNQAEEQGVISLEEIAEQTELNIYPNPNTGSFTVELPMKEAAQIVVTSLSGQVVYNQTVEGLNKLSVDLNTASGIYLVHVTQGHDTYRTKITVQK